MFINNIIVIILLKLCIYFSEKKNRVLNPIKNDLVVPVELRIKFTNCIRMSLYHRSL